MRFWSVFPIIFLKIGYPWLLVNLTVSIPGIKRPGITFRLVSKQNNNRNDEKIEREDEMTSDQIEYSIGDWIVHIYFGVGQILSKEIMTLEGIRQMYFRIKTKNSSYWLPLAKIDFNRVRPLASKYQIKKALALTRKPPRILSKDYSVRGKEISQAINDISLYSKARMIRDLQGRRVSDYLNFGEIEQLKNIKVNLCDEWALVMQQSPETVLKMLDEALKTSTREIKLEKRNNG